MRNLNRNLIIALAWMLATASMLISCSDDTDAISGDKQEMQIVPYGETFIEEAGTRALPTGYQDFTTVNPGSTQAIAIYLPDEDNNCGEPGYFTPSGGGTWTSTVNTMLKTQYYVYGYFPADCSSQASLTSVDYAQGASLKLPGLSSFSTTDVCVTSGVETVGNYGFKMSSVINNKINCLLLDHIYSALLFEFKVDADYADLRQIKLKEVKLQQTSGYEHVTATVNFVPGSTKSVSWSNEGTAQDLEYYFLDESQAEVALTTTFQSLPEVYIPGTASFSFNLVSTYDVYDKKGNRVRENCHATNKISLNNSSVAAGRRNRVQLTVQPTYLYQLSDPDLDNPTIKEI